MTTSTPDIDPNLHQLTDLKSTYRTGSFNIDHQALDRSLSYIQPTSTDKSSEEQVMRVDHLAAHNAPISAHRYHHEDSLGEGTYGEVWRAKDLALQRPVAIKQFKGEVTDAKVAYFKEIQHVGRLNHQGIPTVYDVHTNSQGRPSMVMQYLQGTSLRDVIIKLQEGDPSTLQKYPFPRRIEVMVQVLHILSKAHQEKILHRDIKPENILLGESGEVYLIDWGIALDLEESATDLMLCGTPLYMSPEQLQLQPLNVYSDLYSVGSVAYEFLSLNLAAPYCKSVWALIQELPNYTPKRVDHHVHPSQGAAPSEYSVTIMKALSNNPKDRHQSAEEMLREFQSSLSGQFNIVCPRTFLKHYIFRLSRWVDLNPFINVPILILSVIFFMSSLIGLGIYWGMRLS